MDEPAIRTFLVTEYPRLVAAVGLACGSRAAGEDAVQEALARAWERTERGEHIESVGAWVTTVSMNLARSWWRRLKAERKARDRVSVSAETPPPDDALDLERAHAELPRRQREAVVLHYYLGHPIAEVGGLLGVTEGTIKTSLHRARKTLAEALGEKENDVVGS